MHVILCVSNINCATKNIVIDFNKYILNPNSFILGFMEMPISMSISGSGIWMTATVLENMTLI